MKLNCAQQRPLASFLKDPHVCLDHHLNRTFLSIPVEVCLRNSSHFPSPCLAFESRQKSWAKTLPWLSGSQASDSNLKAKQKRNTIRTSRNMSSECDSLPWETLNSENTSFSQNTDNRALSALGYPVVTLPYRSKTQDVLEKMALQRKKRTREGQ